ncbi:MAG: hypothetical protein KAH18_03225, partial [Psychromonas sp.]|nr:hypothetical protein [Psychromonas sp.]
NDANDANSPQSVKSFKSVQAANCPRPNKTAYACCSNPAWGSLLWVQSWKLISSVVEDRDVCHRASADYDWNNGNNDCTHDTPIFNQGDHRIEKDCQIIQFYPM